jgi:hypothetical protein
MPRSYPNRRQPFFLFADREPPFAVDRAIVLLHRRIIGHTSDDQPSLVRTIYLHNFTTKLNTWKFPTRSCGDSTAENSTKNLFHYVFSAAANLHDLPYVTVYPHFISNPGSHSHGSPFDPLTYRGCECEMGCIINGASCNMLGRHWSHRRRILWDWVGL